MVSMVSNFKRGGWDSFPYVVVLCSCVGCSSMTSPWLVWAADSKEEGWIVSGMFWCFVAVLGVVVA